MENTKNVEVPRDIQMPAPACALEQRDMIKCKLETFGGKEKTPCYQVPGYDWMVPLRILQSLHFPNVSLIDLEKIIHITTADVRKMAHFEVRVMKKFLKPFYLKGKVYPSMTYNKEMATALASVQENYNKIFDIANKTEALAKRREKESKDLHRNPSRSGLRNDLSTDPPDADVSLLKKCLPPHGNTKRDGVTEDVTTAPTTNPAIFNDLRLNYDSDHEETPNSENIMTEKVTDNTKDLRPQELICKLNHVKKSVDEVEKSSSLPSYLRKSCVVDDKSKKSEKLHLSVENSFIVNRWKEKSPAIVENLTIMKGFAQLEAARFSVDTAQISTNSDSKNNLYDDTSRNLPGIECSTASSDDLSKETRDECQAASSRHILLLGDHFPHLNKKEGILSSQDQTQLECAKNFSNAATSTTLKVGVCEPMMDSTVAAMDSRSCNHLSSSSPKIQQFIVDVASRDDNDVTTQARICSEIPVRTEKVHSSLLKPDKTSKCVEASIKSLGGKASSDANIPNNLQKEETHVDVARKNSSSGNSDTFKSVVSTPSGHNKSQTNLVLKLSHETQNPSQTTCKASIADNSQPFSLGLVCNGTIPAGFNLLVPCSSNYVNFTGDQQCLSGDKPMMTVVPNRTILKAEAKKKKKKKKKKKDDLVESKQSSILPCIEHVLLELEERKCKAKNKTEDVASREEKSKSLFNKRDKNKIQISHKDSFKIIDKSREFTEYSRERKTERYEDRARVHFRNGSPEPFLQVSRSFHHIPSNEYHPEEDFRREKMQLRDSDLTSKRNCFYQPYSKRYPSSNFRKDDRAPHRYASYETHHDRRDSFRTDDFLTRHAPYKSFEGKELNPRPVSSSNKKSSAKATKDRVEKDSQSKHTPVQAGINSIPRLAGHVKLVRRTQTNQSSPTKVLEENHKEQGDIQGVNKDPSLNDRLTKLIKSIRKSLDGDVANTKSKPTKGGKNRKTIKPKVLSEHKAANVSNSKKTKRHPSNSKLRVAIRPVAEKSGVNGENAIASCCEIADFVTLDEDWEEASIVKSPTPLQTSKVSSELLEEKADGINSDQSKENRINDMDRWLFTSSWIDVFCDFDINVSNSQIKGEKESDSLLNISPSPNIDPLSRREKKNTGLEMSQLGKSLNQLKESEIEMKKVSQKVSSPTREESLNPKTDSDNSSYPVSWKKQMVETAKCQEIINNDTTTARRDQGNSSKCIPVNRCSLEATSNKNGGISTQEKTNDNDHNKKGLAKKNILEEEVSTPLAVQTNNQISLKEIVKPSEVIDITKSVDSSTVMDDKNAVDTKKLPNSVPVINLTSAEYPSNKTENKLRIYLRPLTIKMCNLQSSKNIGTTLVENCKEEITSSTNSDLYGLCDQADVQSSAQKTPPTFSQSTTTSKTSQLNSEQQETTDLQHEDTLQTPTLETSDAQNKRVTANETKTDLDQRFDHIDLSGDALNEESPGNFRKELKQSNLKKPTSLSSSKKCDQDMVKQTKKRKLLNSSNASVLTSSTFKKRKASKSSSIKVDQLPSLSSKGETTNINKVSSVMSNNLSHDVNTSDNDDDAGLMSCEAILPNIKKDSLKSVRTTNDNEHFKESDLDKNSAHIIATSECNQEVNKSFESQASSDQAIDQSSACLEAKKTLILKEVNDHIRKEERLLTVTDIKSVTDDIDLSETRKDMTTKKSLSSSVESSPIVSCFSSLNTTNMEITNSKLDAKRKDEEKIFTRKTNVDNKASNASAHHEMSNNVLVMSTAAVSINNSHIQQQSTSGNLQPIKEDTHDTNFPSASSIPTTLSATASSVSSVNNSVISDTMLLQPPLFHDANDDTYRHGIMEIKLHTPRNNQLHSTAANLPTSSQSLPFLRRRIPYIHITYKFPKSVDDAHKLNSHTMDDGEMTSSTVMKTLQTSTSSITEVTLIRFREVALTLRAKPSDLVTEAVRMGLRITPPNPCTDRVYNTIYNPKLIVDVALLNSLGYDVTTKLGAINEDYMIELDDYVNVILPAFYWSMFGTEESDISQHISIKRYQAVACIDDDIVKLLSKSFLYNNILIKEDAVTKPTLRSFKRNEVKEDLVVPAKRSRKRSHEEISNNMSRELSSPSATNHVAKSEQIVTILPSTVASITASVIAVVSVTTSHQSRHKTLFTNSATNVKTMLSSTQSIPMVSKPSQFMKPSVFSKVGSQTNSSIKSLLTSVSSTQSSQQFIAKSPSSSDVYKPAAECPYLPQTTASSTKLFPLIRVKTCTASVPGMASSSLKTVHKPPVSAVYITSQNNHQSAKRQKLITLKFNQMIPSSIERKPDKLFQNALKYPDEKFKSDVETLRTPLKLRTLSNGFKKQGKQLLQANIPLLDKLRITTTT